jgi:hypothetical protein
MGRVESQADRTDIGIRRGAEAGGATAENLGALIELNVHLQADDGLVLADRKLRAGPTIANLGNG